MDTSKEYIKMCDKSIEVQSLRPSIIIAEVREYNQIECLPTGDFFYSKTQILVWLPRQDQLQELIFDSFKNSTLSALYQALMNFGEDEQLIEGELISRDHYFDTHEQLLLAYVMYWEHHKTWNGEDWVEIPL